MYQTKNLGLNITEIDKDKLQPFNFDTDLGDNFKAIDEKTLSHRNITNCLLEVPQDIKLEIVDGVITLKEGSKVYVPNGPGVFEEKIIYTDISNKTIGNDDIFLAVSKEGGLIALDAQSFTVTERPETIQGVPLYYNITTNKIEYYDNSVWHTGASFPIAIVTRSESGFTSIDQVFNGFGYIGSTVFALPGVKGLIPNGKNEDETLKNIDFITDAVIIRTFTNNYTNDYKFYFNGTSFSIDRIIKEDTNANILLLNNKVITQCEIGSLTLTSDVVSNFKIKKTFKAVDYNDYQTKITELETKIATLQAAVKALQG